MQSAAEPERRPVRLGRAGAAARRARGGPAAEQVSRAPDPLTRPQPAAASPAPAGAPAAAAPARTQHQRRGGRHPHLAGQDAQQAAGLPYPPVAGAARAGPGLGVDRPLPRLPGRLLAEPHRGQRRGGRPHPGEPRLPAEPGPAQLAVLQPPAGRRPALARALAGAAAHGELLGGLHSCSASCRPSSWSR